MLTAMLQTKIIDQRNQEDPILIWPNDRFGHFRQHHLGSHNGPSEAPATDRSGDVGSHAQSTDVEPSWLNELLDSPKPASAGKFFHRKSVSDTIAARPYPSSLSRIDEADEDAFAHAFTSLRCFTNYDHADAESHDVEALGSKFLETEGLLFARSLHPSPISKLQNLCRISWRPGRDYVAKVNTASDIAAGDNNRQPHSRGTGTLAGTRFVKSAVADLSAIKKDGTHDSGDNGGPGCSPCDFVQNSDLPTIKRYSAQRSRVRKLQYIADLENYVNSLQVEVSVLATHVAFLDHQRNILIAENTALKQKLRALTNDSQNYINFVDPSKFPRFRLYGFLL